MPEVFSFQAIGYPSGASGRDQSALIAPPYDVLDAAGKARLLARDGRNIVGIDLPHTPAKELGPAGVYAAAGERFRSFLANGTLVKSERPVMFAYRETWTQAGREGKVETISRAGMACCVETVPFGARAGGGILPHEETFSGPKEDRLALMRATAAQLSPIFGLHADERGAAKGVLARVMASRAADRIARTEDGTLHEVWTIADEATIGEYRAALAGEDVFVADGHHRYNTALNYLRELEGRGEVPADHPARRIMFVLVGMSDPGLVIWPTHRVIGGMGGYSFHELKGFVNHCDSEWELDCKPGLQRLAKEVNSPRSNGRVLGLWDCKSDETYFFSICDWEYWPWQSQKRFRGKPQAWKDLPVAYCQHVLVERMCQDRFNGGKPVKWAFPHTIDEVEAIARGDETGAGGAFGATGAQLAIILPPTPLEAVREVSRAGELMPQKSTFFYPKLATGLFMHQLG